MFQAPLQSIWLLIASCKGCTLLYINCTNLDWLQQCTLHSIKPFGAYSHLVQLMYGRTRNLYECSIRELWCNVAVRLYIDCTNFNWGQQCFTSIMLPIVSCNGCTRLYIICTNLDWVQQCSLHSIKPFGAFSHTVQFMYGRTRNFSWLLY